MEIIIEIIMNLRAKDLEKQQNHAHRKYYVGKMISSKKTNNTMEYNDDNEY